MSDLRIIQGGKESPPTHYVSASDFQPANDVQFGSPPSLLIGTITALLGACAGVASLLVFFTLWQPEAYISQDWLIFVLAGACVGFFLRFERPFEEEFGPKTNGDAE